ncbi:MAG: right-handed parallel beta-helix repeat-containing protein [Planctomycetes bacterium]|nr:right-handed parallel beta-helix repeat-containing protein [Planctomycetota bacterium]
MKPKPTRLNAETLESRDTPAIFTVTNTTDGAAGSLRDAITRANASPGADTIAFAIPTSDMHFVDANGNGKFNAGDYWSIAPTSALPAITQTVILDGWSQPGPTDNSRPVIELNGTNAGAAVDGLTLTNHTGSRIRGLVINRFTGNGITINGGGQHGIVGDFIGTDSSGTSARANAGVGVVLTGSHVNTIGGTIAKQRNLISGNTVQGVLFTNSVSNAILGNLIGTNITGDTAIQNGSVKYDGDGVRISGGGFNIIGGSTPEARNLLSGNFDDGVDIRDGSEGNEVLGNYIGTKLGGRAILPNKADGVYIQDASYNLVGSIVTGEANVLSGNGYNGVFLYGDSHNNTIEGNFIGTNSKADHLGNSTLVTFADGIFLAQLGAPVGPSLNTITQNIIAYNNDSAISVDISPTANTVGNTFTQNSIYGNAHIAIDFASTGLTTPNDSSDPDPGPNRLQNFPVLLAPTTNANGTHIVSGTLNSTPNRTFRIEFFASGSAGQGRLFLGAGTVTTAADGNTPQFSLSFSRPPGMRFITATATDLSTGDTSQFSASVT